MCQDSFIIARGQRVLGVSTSSFRIGMISYGYLVFAAHLHLGVLEKVDYLLTHKCLPNEKPHLEKTAHHPETLDIELDKGFEWVSLLWK